MGPPNRAYLKLQEALVRMGRWPQPGETCLDLGACPGGWTYVMASLGAEVVAVDKAPLAKAVAAMPRVQWRGESAFADSMDPLHRTGWARPVDWLFSDIACYPTRLLGLVQRWMRSGLVKNIVVTLKFQGDAATSRAEDHEAAARFAAIPGGRLLHMHYNKHELTFMWSADGYDAAVGAAAEHRLRMGSAGDNGNDV